MYSFDARIRYSECDETGRLSLVSMMNYLQDCSTFQSARMGGGIDALGGRGLAWVLAAWRVEVERMPRFDEAVTVSTWCHEMTRAHALRNFQIADGEGRAVVRAESQWFVYDVGAGHATRVPEDQRVYLSDDAPLKMGPLPRRMHAEGEGRRAADRTVTRADLDTNHHVNNANYVRFAVDALEALGIDVPMGTLQVLYRAQARLGDVVRPSVYVCEGGWDVVLSSPEGVAYAHVRLQDR